MCERGTFAILSAIKLIFIKETRRLEASFNPSTMGFREEDERGRKESLLLEEMGKLLQFLLRKRLD